MSRQGKFSPETEAKASLLSVLFTKKMLNANAAIINELPLYKFSRRVDIALIDKKIIFFEIKSKSDKLTRLEGQAKAFSYYCDKLIILCAKKHVQNVLKKAPKCSGIWQLNDDLSISVVRVGKESKLADKEKLIDLVNLDELRSILRTNGIKASGKRRKHVVLLANPTSSFKRIAKFYSIRTTCQENI